MEPHLLDNMVHLVNTEHPHPDSMEPLLLVNMAPLLLANMAPLLLVNTEPLPLVNTEPLLLATMEHPRQGDSVHPLDTPWLEALADTLAVLLEEGMEGRQYPAGTPTRAWLGFTLLRHSCRDSAGSTTRCWTR